MLTSISSQCLSIQQARRIRGPPTGCAKPLHPPLLSSKLEATQSSDEQVAELLRIGVDEFNEKKASSIGGAAVEGGKLCREGTARPPYDGPARGKADICHHGRRLLHGWTPSEVKGLTLSFVGVL